MKTFFFFFEVLASYVGKQLDQTSIGRLGITLFLALLTSSTDLHDHFFLLSFTQTFLPLVFKKHSSNICII